jgi:hypothetical protein
MNQPDKWLWQGRAADSRRVCATRLCAVWRGAAARPAGLRRRTWKPVAYSILFQ